MYAANARRAEVYAKLDEYERGIALAVSIDYRLLPQ